MDITFKVLEALLWSVGYLLKGDHTDGRYTELH